jgi:hypothetical protein
MFMGPALSSAREVAREGMVSCQPFLQPTQAKAAHNTLQAIASNTDPYPKGRGITNTAGLNTRATISNVTVVLYWVPVDF